MIRDDALELAKRVKRSWRTHQTLDEWVGYLMPFDDPAIAASALDQLREVEPLAFKDFGAKYRALAWTATSTPHVEPAAGPRLSRDEVRAVLLGAGAPARFVNPKGNPQ